MERRPVTIYTHEQATPATTWTIVHAIGTYPIVDAYTTEGGQVQKIIPSSVTYVDPNTCTITFTTPRSGFATVV